MRTMKRPLSARLARRHGRAASVRQTAQAQRAEYEALVATHARANGVPAALVHRVIVRESRYQPALVGRGGTIGLMQIKLATARGLGYTGDAEGLRDPDTNLTYGGEISRRRLSRRERRSRPRHALLRQRLLRRRQAPAARARRASGVELQAIPCQRCRRKPKSPQIPRGRLRAAGSARACNPVQFPAIGALTRPRIGLH